MTASAPAVAGNAGVRRLNLGFVGRDEHAPGIVREVQAAIAGLEGQPGLRPVKIENYS